MGPENTIEPSVPLEEEEGLSAGVIAGIATGSVVACLLLLLVIYFCVNSGGKSRRMPPPQYPP